MDKTCGSCKWWEPHEWYHGDKAHYGDCVSGEVMRRRATVHQGPIRYLEEDFGCRFYEPKEDDEQQD